MDEKNLADRHNRRANIALVSKLAKESGTPFLVWPEDKFLLRLNDLPTIGYNRRPNQPVNWTNMQATRFMLVNDDQDLRDKVKEGFAYTLVVDVPLEHLTGGLNFVQEWTVKTKEVLFYAHSN